MFQKDKMMEKFRISPNTEFQISRCGKTNKQTEGQFAFEITKNFLAHAYYLEFRNKSGKLLVPVVKSRGR